MTYEQVLDIIIWVKLLSKTSSKHCLKTLKLFQDGWFGLAPLWLWRVNTHQQWDAWGAPEAQLRFYFNWKAQILSRNTWGHKLKQNKTIKKLFSEVLRCELQHMWRLTIMQLWTKQHDSSGFTFFGRGGWKKNYLPTLAFRGYKCMKCTKCT